MTRQNRTISDDSECPPTSKVIRLLLSLYKRGLSYTFCSSLQDFTFTSRRAVSLRYSITAEILVLRMYGC